MAGKTKCVYVYTEDWKFVEYYKSTFDCADAFEKDVDYINHVIWLKQKIRRDGKWYRLTREKIDV